jgi:hypothetical protein
MVHRVTKYSPSVDSTPKFEKAWAAVPMARICPDGVRYGEKQRNFCYKMLLSYVGVICRRESHQ